MSEADNQEAALTENKIQVTQHGSDEELYRL